MEGDESFVVSDESVAAAAAAVAPAASVAAAAAVCRAPPPLPRPPGKRLAAAKRSTPSHELTYFYSVSIILFPWVDKICEAVTCACGAHRLDPDRPRLPNRKRRRYGKEDRGNRKPRRNLVLPPNAYPPRGTLLRSLRSGRRCFSTNADRLPHSRARALARHPGIADIASSQIRRPAAPPQVRSPRSSGALVRSIRGSGPTWIPRRT